MKLNYSGRNRYAFAIYFFDKVLRYSFRKLLPGFAWERDRVFSKGKKAFKMKNDRWKTTLLNRHEESILPAFYKQIFQTKVFCADFLYLQLVFVFFAKEYWCKSCL